MLPSRVGVRMHFSNGFSFFWLRAESAPKPLVSKKQWNLMIFKVGSDARATEAAQEACRKLARKNAFPKRKKHAFSSFFLFLASPRRGSKKCCQNGLRSPPGEAPGDPAGAQNRSTSRLRPARGARQVMFGIPQVSFLSPWRPSKVIFGTFSRRPWAREAFRYMLGPFLDELLMFLLKNLSF